MVAEQVDGLDSSYNSGWSEYPLDSVFVRKEERSVNEVVKRIRAKRYQLDPDFQRDFVWGLEKQSKLIESCLMRIPLPVFYVAEAKDGKIIVVDGLQRLTTLQRYMEGNFALIGLASDKEQAKGHPLDGKRYKDLPLTLQERIEDTQLIFYILDAKAPERARLDIFDRVNSGVALTRQQMRNSLYNGPATRWLKAAAESQPFLTATGRSLVATTMRDREAINRFCAFRLLTYSAYRGGDMDGFLGQTLERMNLTQESELDQLRVEFDHSMRSNQILFGNHAFRKSLAESDPAGKRSPLNIAFFDVCSVIFAGFPQKPSAHRKEAARKAVIDLLADGDFVAAISAATNSTNQIRKRFEKATEALQSVVS